MKEKKFPTSGPSNPPDESAQNVSKNNPFGRIIPPFFFESSESERVFNYLHDSNSILRAAGINSEWVSGGTVLAVNMSGRSCPSRFFSDGRMCFSKPLLVALNCHDLYVTWPFSVGL